MSEQTLSDKCRTIADNPASFAKLSSKYNLGGAGLVNYARVRNLRDAGPINPFGQGPSTGPRWFSLMFTDPTVIEAIVVPCKMIDIIGERVVGSWADLQASFMNVSQSWDTSVYGDRNQSGDASAELTFFYRENILIQLWKYLGDLEQAQYAKSPIDWAAQINANAILGLKKEVNKILAFGVEGKKTFGFLNDPNLQPAIQPYTKTDMKGNSLGTTEWLKTQDPRQIYADIKDKLVQELINRSMTLVDLDSPMTLVYPSEIASALANTNDFGLTVRQLVQETMPNVKFKSLPEAGIKFSGGKSNIRQIVLYADELNGHKVVQGATSTALRAGRVETYSTDMRQKLINGSYGCLYFQPAGQVTMTGV